MSQHTKQLDKGRKLRRKKKKEKSHKSECPRVESHFPVFTFQIFTDLSPLPLAKDAPPGLQATDETLRFDEMSQHAKQLDKRRKLDKTGKKKSHGSECPGVDKKK
jgi:hypothetical protein